MLLVGKGPESTAAEQALRFAAILVLAGLMIPWLLISGGCIVVGCLAISRGETSLIICPPAGLALLIGPPAVFILERRWYPPISGFTFDGIVPQFEFGQDGDLQSRVVTDVLTVQKAQKPRRPIRGYYVTFRDGHSIFVPRQLTHADELYETLHARPAAT